MSNQQSEKQSFPNTNLDLLGQTENCSLPTTSQLHLFRSAWSLLRTILNPASWWLSQSCDSYTSAFCCRDVGQMGQITNTAWKNTCGSASQLQQWHVGWHRTRQIYHWPWNVIPQQWWLPTTSQLHLFSTTWSLLKTILDPASRRLPLLYRSVVSNGPKTSTAQKSKSGTVPIQLQQWHPCEW